MAKRTEKHGDTEARRRKGMRLLPLFTTPVSPFFKGEFDDDLAYSPLSKGVRGLFLLHFCFFL